MDSNEFPFMRAHNPILRARRRVGRPRSSGSSSSSSISRGRSPSPSATSLAIVPFPGGVSGTPLSPGGVDSGTTPPSSGGVSGTVPSGGGVSGGTPPSGGGVSGGTPKRRRGRPRGSQNKKKKKVEEGVGVGFKVHIFTIYAGQDICSAIEAFSLQGRCRVVIISATGSICYVTLLHQGSGDSVVYDGHFNILTLGCSVGESGVSGFTLLMSGSTGAVYGGEVVGSSVIAASPIQVVLGTFTDEVKKPPLNLLASSSGEDQRDKKPEASSSAPLLLGSSSGEHHKDIKHESSPSLSPSNMLNLTSSEDQKG